MSVSADRDSGLQGSALKGSVRVTGSGVEFTLGADDRGNLKRNATDDLDGRSSKKQNLGVTGELEAISSTDTIALDDEEDVDDGADDQEGVSDEENVNVQPETNTTAFQSQAQSTFAQSVSSLVMAVLKPVQAVSMNPDQQVEDAVLVPTTVQQIIHNMHQQVYSRYNGTINPSTTSSQQSENNQKGGLTAIEASGYKAFLNWSNASKVLPLKAMETTGFMVLCIMLIHCSVILVRLGNNESIDKLTLLEGVAWLKKKCQSDTQEDKELVRRLLDDTARSMARDMMKAGDKGFIFESKSQSKAAQPVAATLSEDAQLDEPQPAGKKGKGQNIKKASLERHAAHFGKDLYLCADQPLFSRLFQHLARFELTVFLLLTRARLFRWRHPAVFLAMLECLCESPVRPTVDNIRRMLSHGHEQPQCQTWAAVRTLPFEHTLTEQQIGDMKNGWFTLVQLTLVKSPPKPKPSANAAAAVSAVSSEGVRRSTRKKHNNGKKVGYAEGEEEEEEEEEALVGVVLVESDASRSSGAVSNTNKNIPAIQAETIQPPQLSTLSVIYGSNLTQSGRLAYAFQAHGDPGPGFNSNASCLPVLVRPWQPSHCPDRQLSDRDMTQYKSNMKTSMILSNAKPCYNVARQYGPMLITHESKPAEVYLASEFIFGVSLDKLMGIDAQSGSTVQSETIFGKFFGHQSPPPEGAEGSGVEVNDDASLIRREVAIQALEGYLYLKKNGILHLNMSLQCLSICTVGLMNLVHSQEVSRQLIDGEIWPRCEETIKAKRDAELAYEAFGAMPGSAQSPPSPVLHQRMRVVTHLTGIERITFDVAAETNVSPMDWNVEPADSYKMLGIQSPKWWHENMARDQRTLSASYKNAIWESYALWNVAMTVLQILIGARLETLFTKDEWTQIRAKYQEQLIKAEPNSQTSLIGFLFTLFTLPQDAFNPALNKKPLAILSTGYKVIKPETIYALLKTMTHHSAGTVGCVDEQAADRLQNELKELCQQQ